MAVVLECVAATLNHTKNQLTASSMYNMFISNQFPILGRGVMGLLEE